MIEMKGKFTSAKIMIDEVESECISLLTHILNHPACVNPIAIMPDTHAGKGIVIGFTMKLGDKIVPNFVGVDLGCGVFSVNISKLYREDFDWKFIDSEIRKYIPLGMNVNKKPCSEEIIENICKVTNDKWNHFTNKYFNEHGIKPKSFKADYKWFESLCKKINTSTHQVRCSLGSLGGGNHYIECGKSNDTNDVWFTIHSGSRNFGLRIANFHQERAKNNLLDKRMGVENEIKNKILNDPSNLKDRAKLIADMKKENKTDITIDMKDSEYLEGDDMFEYLFDMCFAQSFSDMNRKTMMNNIIRILENITGDNLGVNAENIHSIHNYIDFSDMIIRKGAIASYENTSKIIIPLNMRDGSLICVGKSNPEWNFSAPHGAGRIYSRTKAKAEIKLEDFVDSMKGIFSTSVSKDTLDESPFAYKDMNLIIESIEPTCEILDRIIPIYNLKASEGEENIFSKKNKKVSEW